MSRVLRLPAGKPLSERLFAAGVEFPCGGEGTCNGCLVRVDGGDWEPGCRCRTTAAVTVEVEQWSSPVMVLTDEVRLEAEPRAGFGYAIDLGSTTLVAQRVELSTGEVAEVHTAINAQTRHGADLMSRIAFDLKSPGKLTGLIRRQLGHLLHGSAEEAIVAGNTAMHHLFCGLSVEPLASVPFRSPNLGGYTFEGRELGWPVKRVTVLPCLGGFVGGDLLAGLAAVAPAENEALVDLGTNGEVCIARGGEILCASTAAGPAFESRRFRRGSQLVEMVAQGLDEGWVQANGRLGEGAPEKLKQSDVRQLQLGKAAIAAGLELLGGAGRIHLAGAFGNYVRESSAKRIGLLPGDAPVHPAGNSSLRGARLLLLQPERRSALIADILERARHVELATLPRFQDCYVGNMVFP